MVLQASQCPTTVNAHLAQMGQAHHLIQNVMIQPFSYIEHPQLSQREYTVSYHFNLCLRTLFLMVIVQCDNSR